MCNYSKEEKSNERNHSFRVITYWALCLELGPHNRGDISYLLVLFVEIQLANSNRYLDCYYDFKRHFQRKGWRVMSEKGVCKYCGKTLENENRTICDSCSSKKTLIKRFFKETEPLREHIFSQ